MKNVRMYTNVITLLLTALLLPASNTLAMAAGEVPTIVTIEEKIDQTTQEAKGLLADLKTFRKCWRSKDGCPAEVTSRLKTQGAKVAKAVGVLVLATAAIVGGTYWYRQRTAARQAAHELEPAVLYQNALNQFGLNDDQMHTLDREFIKAVAEQNDSADIFNRYESIKDLLERLNNPEQVIEIAEWINTKTKNAEVSKTVKIIAREYKKLSKKAK